MKTKTEPELIQHILAGEWRNYAILVDKYQKKVFNYVNYLMGNREDAEEVTQDTFTKAYRSLGQFRGDAKFSTWLLRIAHFESLTRLRKKKPTETGIDHVVCFSENTMDNPQYTLQQRDKAKALNLALDKLKPDERSVITLFYYEDLSVKEIVEVTKLKESNVKIHLHRARKKLFDILSKMGIKEITYE